MYIPQDRAVMALQLLLEGNSIRSTERITGMDRNTIMRLLVLAGKKCEHLMRVKIEHLRVKDVEADEIWGFVGKKEGHKQPGDEAYQTGDAWCFVAMERTTKLVLAFHLGKRNRIGTEAFIAKLRYATSNERFQLTTDGFPGYTPAIAIALADRVDYAQLIKVYGTPRDGEQRYSPAEIIGTEVVPVMGKPNPRRICTSHVERQNLSIRMGMRRMTRLTNAFSKRWESLEAAYALHFAYYNFCRIHKTLRVTPAMEQGISDHVLTIKELIA